MIESRLLAIARRPARRAPMQLVDAVEVHAGGGLEGDHKGAKFPRRGITVLACEAWQQAIAELAELAGPVPLPWTARRANLLVEGVRLPRARGGLVRIGAILIEVTDQTVPCRRMEEAHAGLLEALYPDWRGGITARVVTGGLIRVGDPVSVEFSPPEHTPRLPG